MAINFSPPKPPPQGSAAYEYSMVALTPGAPPNVALDDVLDLKRSTLGNGLSGKSGTIAALLDIKNIWLGIFKKPSKGNIIVMAVGLIFAVVWAWTKYLPGLFIYMSPGGIKSVLAFLFGTFNNVPARVLHFSSIMTLAAAFLPSLFGGNITKSFDGINGTIAIIKKFVSNKGSKTTAVAVLSIGIGMFLSNYIMRNCSYNKYFPCLTIGITLLLASTTLFDSTFVRLCTGISNDLLRLLKLKNVMTKYKIAVQTGLGIGLVSSILACLLRKPLGDYIGYILGCCIIVFGIVLTTMPKPGKSGKVS